MLDGKHFENMSRIKLFWLTVLITWSIFREHALIVASFTAQSGSICAGKQLKVNVKEGLTSGNIVFKFEGDTNIVYSLHDKSTLFEISQAGSVTNIVTLDREGALGSVITLIVLAQRNKVHGSKDNSWVNACLLTITIDDINDNFPQFDKDLYVGYIKENLQRNSIVKGLHGLFATDLDSEANSVKNYRVLPGNGADRFETVTEDLNGVKFLSIRTKVSLDREESSFYVLNIEAIDGGSPPKTSRVQIRINIEDVNDCAPKFTSSEYLISVHTFTPVATQVLKINAQDDDSDENSNIYYFFKKFRTKTQKDQLFTMDPYTGVLRVARRLDFSAGSSIDLTVVAKDRGFPAKRAETVVKIVLYGALSRPLKPPGLARKTRFVKPSYLVRIREDLPVNSHILQPHVVGLSTSSRFKVLSAQSIPFQVETNSAILYLVKNVDFESKQKYEFAIVLTSSKNVQTNVTVLIDDANENYNAPVFEKENVAKSFKADPRVSHSITKVKASDRDIKSKLTYAIIGGNGVGRFYIDSMTGSVFPTPGLNWEVTQQLGLVIEARDNATIWKSSRQFLLIDVLDQQDCNPMFEWVMYRAKVGENLPRGTFVAATKATLCRGDKVEYFISGGNIGNSFEMDEYSGKCFDCISLMSS